MATQPFQWGFGGQQINTPEQAARQRAIAEALIGQSATPGQNWTQGLADIAAALSGTILEGRVSEAEAAGRERAGGLFANLAIDQDPNAIIAALTSPDAAWASPSQTSIASALLNQGLQNADPMRQLQMEKLRTEIAGGGGPAETFFGTPLFTQDADGNLTVNQLGNQGTLNPLELPEGQRVAPPTTTQDTGTEIITFDRFGNELFRTPKNLRDAASESSAGTVEGKMAAESAAAAPGDIQTGKMALDLINQIKTHPELEWATGTAAGLGGNAVPGTGRFDFQNLVDQAKSGAFLSAIQQMRGMGSLSNAEGQAATQAVTRMNTSTSTQAFLKALDDYEGIVQSGIDRARSKLGQSSASQVAPSAGAVRVFNPATGRLE